MKHILFALVLLFGVTSVVAAGDFQDAEDAFARQDYSTAVAKYTKAADAGNADAQYRLGTMYQKEREGDGVAHDDPAAVRWYRKAAEAGHAEAQNNLGWMYANGRGVPRDDQEAVRWYKKAAEAGQTLTQYYLGVRYRDGKGVPQDNVQAHRWFSIAAATTTDKKIRGRAVRGRDKLVQNMSPQQIAEAEQLASKWKPTTSTAPDR